MNINGLCRKGVKTVKDIIMCLLRLLIAVLRYPDLCYSYCIIVDCSLVCGPFNFKNVPQKTKNVSKSFHCKYIYEMLSEYI